MKSRIINNISKNFTSIFFYFILDLVSVLKRAVLKRKNMADLQMLPLALSLLFHWLWCFSERSCKHVELWMNEYDLQPAMLIWGYSTHAISNAYIGSFLRFQENFVCIRLTFIYKRLFVLRLRLHKRDRLRLSGQYRNAFSLWSSGSEIDFTELPHCRISIMSSIIN